MVGSHVPKTSAQLNHLLESDLMQAMEFEVEAYIAAESKEDFLAALAQELNQHLAEGRSCVLYTSRELILGCDDASNLELSQVISDGLVNVMQLLECRPRYLIAKGGITSSDIATKALCIRRAMVRGQILPGIPVWSPDEHAGFPGLCYVVFPGNVGSDAALTEAVLKLEPTTTN